MEGFCRGCLMKYNEPSQLLSYTEKIRRLLIYSTGIQVNHGDAATFQLCKDCFVNMKMSCKFKKQCRTSQKKFQHYLSLKEAGDAFEFSNYVKNNGDSLRFPSYSRQSTPAHHRTGDDDNESTCTSIRNFMTDILQDEEVPDNEAQIIKEVIEEQTDILDDSLDSHWLQDEVSIDTDFRLDFSFSPLSTPHSVNHNVCCTPNKQFEADSQKLIGQSNKAIDLPTVYGTNKDQDLNEKYLSQDRPPNVKDKLNDDSSTYNLETSSNLINEKTESEEVIEDINENVKYVPQNENDIAVRNLLKCNNQDDNTKTECLYAVKVMQSEEFTIQQSELYNENLFDNSNENNYEVHDENQIIDNNVNDNQGNISLSIQNSNEAIIKEGESNILQNNSSEQPESDYYTVDTHMNEDFLIKHDSLLSDVLKNITSSNKGECPYDINNVDEHHNKDDELHDMYKSQNNTSFLAENLLMSQSEHNLGTGASTPTINHLIFGEKLEFDEDSNKLDKIADKLSIQSGGTDILDKMLKEGVKELQIETPSPNIESSYDLENCYCNNCDKTFKSTKALKIHLAKFHNLKLPYIKKRNYDNQPRTCEICGEVLKHFASFQKHMKNHKEPIHQCSKCKLIFSTKTKLITHMKCHNPLQNIKQKPSKDSKIIICPICGREYSNGGNFSIHMKRHNKNYVATCNICGKGYYRKPDLDNHMRLHTGEKPFACEYCDMRFRIRYGLIKHVRVHLDEKHFECAHCAKKYVLRSDLVFHLKHSMSCLQVRSGLKPKLKKAAKTYKCFYCEDTFLNKKDFIRHQKNYRPCEKMHNNPAYASKKVQLPFLYVEKKDNNIGKTIRMKQDEEECEDVDVLEV